MRALLLALGLSLATGGAALAQAGDPAKGEQVFKKCQACHVANKPQNRVGPNLVGLFGRKAGTVDGFNYSKANKESGVVWDEAVLDQYLTNPKAYMPGNKMAFPGLPKPEDRANVIAYLKQATATQ